jgi:hypothetical protein
LIYIINVVIIIISSSGGSSSSCYCWYLVIVRRKETVWTLTVQTYFNNQLNAQFLYSITICMLHYNPRHVSSIKMPIFRRTVCRMRADCIALCSHPAYCTAVYREWRYQMLW